MKKLELSPGKFFSVCAGISIVILSVSILISTVGTANANDTAPSNVTSPINAPMVESGVNVYPFGYHDGSFYWLEYNNTGWHFNSRLKTSWK